MLANTFLPNTFYIKIILVCLSFAPALYSASILDLINAKNKTISTINFLLAAGFAIYFFIITASANTIVIDSFSFYLFLSYFYLNLLSFVLLFKGNEFKHENFIILISGIILFSGLTLNFLIPGQVTTIWGGILILIYIIFISFSLVKLNIFKTTHLAHQILLKSGLILVLILGYMGLTYYCGAHQLFWIISLAYFIISIEAYYNFFNIFITNINFQPYEYNKESRNIIKNLSLCYNISDIFSKLTEYFKELIDIDDIAFYIPQGFNNSGKIDLPLVKFDFKNNTEDRNAILDNDIYKIISDKRAILSLDNENNQIVNKLKEKKLCVILPVYAKEQLLCVILFSQKKKKHNYLYIDCKLIELIGENLSLILERIRTQINQLNEKIGLIETMAGTIINEMNKPLNIIKNNLYSIKTDNKYLVFINKSVNELIEKIKNKDSDPEKNLKYLDFINTQVIGIEQSLEAIHNSEESLSKLIRNFLIYTIDSKHIAKNSIQLKNIIEKYALNFTYELKKSGIKLNLIINTEAAVNAAETQIEIILSNLIDNALQAINNDPNIETKNKKEIDIELKEKQVENQRLIILKIKDTGLGILEEEKAKIFDPFIYSKQFFSGPGLGLTTVKRIIDDLGASIEISSSTEGTSFTIIFRQ
ncbi:MAG: HAMP domain-containing sensor histidine kinase [Candidatus Margulisiibacteriota bacterium]